MDRLTENKIVLVVRNTRLEDLLARFNTVSQARFYIEHLNADFSDYVTEHEQYRDAVSKAESALRRLGRLHTLHRAFLPNYIFGKDDTVVVLGQDGLVANTMKYSSDRPVIGVNPDPKRWDGVLLPFLVNDIEKVVLQVFHSKHRIQDVSMAKARTTDGRELYAVNDFFIGVKSHVSARYTIRVGTREERHSSSGVIVSTGLGSTGWFKSLIAGALAIAGQVWEGDLSPKLDKGFPWDADYLYFTVREPFPSKTTQIELIFGRITAGDTLTLASLMPADGLIFSDGIESDCLEFNSGTQVNITVADKKGRLVV